MNIDEICHALGISKKTFYQYYDSKEDLVGDMIQSDITDAQEMFENFVKGKSTIEILSYVFNRTCKSVSESDFKLRQEIKKYYPDTFRSNMEIKIKLMKTNLRCYYDKGVEEGVFRKDLNYEVTMAFFALSHKAIGLYYEGEIALGENEIEKELLGETFKDILIHVMLTPEGLKEYEYNLQSKQEKKG